MAGRPAAARAPQSDLPRSVAFVMPTRRPTLSQAVRRCPRGAVVAARGEGGEDVAVVRLLSGQVCVVADRCPHDGGPLSDGFLDGDRLVCARHQWEVDPRTGVRVRPACDS
jgi:nitrite reductase/ring-hydroxylating ferredoxin subunit